MPEVVEGLTGVPMEVNLVPGSPEWLAAGISSSRVASILNKGYSSRFVLWHTIAGNLPYDSTESEIQRRGRLLEPAIAQWFAEEHRDLQVVTTGTWHAVDNPKHLASPDRLLVARNNAVGILECKSGIHPDGWGVPGTAEIPEPYFIQVQWLLYCLGAESCYVPKIGNYLEFSEYAVQRDDAFIANLVREVDDFLDTLPGGPNFQTPPIDGSEVTYQAVRKLNPKIAEGSVEVPAELALEWFEAKAQKDHWEKRARQLAGEIVDRMGPFRDAVVGDQRVAYRKPARGGTVSLTAVTAARPYLLTTNVSEEVGA